jgi:hypothetical protein
MGLQAGGEASLRQSNLYQELMNHFFVLQADLRHFVQKISMTPCDPFIGMMLEAGFSILDLKRE